MSIDKTRIGITEAGDASLDYSWIKKLESCTGVILITKNITDKFIDEVTNPSRMNKIIIHATCTGMGDTIIEPNVPYYKTQLAQVRKLINRGFPEERIIIRVDPIVPTEKGLQTAQKVFDESPIKRFRFSVLDMYPHARNRFKAAGVPLPYGENRFQASPAQFVAMKKWLENQPADYTFECCAETWFSDIPNVKAVGCVSENDLHKLNISTTTPFATGMQRSTCLCLSCKTELLSNKKRCAHGCLYCYWKD